MLIYETSGKAWEMENFCDRCAVKTCKGESEDGAYPSACPSLRAPLQAEALTSYDAEDHDFAVNATVVTTFARKQLTRVEETMAFARVSGFKSIGVAFCSALANEAAAFAEILRDNGFEVESAICKNGSIPRETLGEPYLTSVAESADKPLCNPVAQALLFNEAKTDLNVIVGLCVGHDTLFMRHSAAPVTCLVVKDHVLGNNPAAALTGEWEHCERLHHAKLPNASVKQGS